MSVWVRSEELKRVQDKGSSTESAWDVVVIGGGATGLGIALDSAARGYQTLLLERNDFTQGTSSRSTKLVHGGVRYLRQGQISLVFEALRERGRLRLNAPHLVRVLPFVVTARRFWERWFYKIGLTMYDLLSGRYRFGKNRALGREKLQSEMSTLRSGLSGGVLFYDGQMDDARLGLALAKTAVQKGACTLNYCEVTALRHDQEGKVCGLTFIDRLSDTQGSTETEAKIEVNARVVINATGVFIDQVRSLEDGDLKALVKPSQGAHVVLPKRFLPQDRAVVFPETPDGRVLFAVPWYDRVLIGTTDVSRDEVEDEPMPLAEEIDFILEQARDHFAEAPKESDILSVFAGLRPLVAPPQGKERSTSKISREHNIMIGGGGVFHITGGKWTTYRKMAEEMIDTVIREGRLAHRPCATTSLKLVGWAATEGILNVESVYGSEHILLQQLSEERPELNERLDPQLPYCGTHVVFAARCELAVTVEDVLSRRTRALLLDAQAAVNAAPTVARLLAAELNRDEAWITSQVQSFTQLAARYTWPRGEE